MNDVDLRPMTLGEVLDRTFKLYRSNFWLFAGIMSLPFLLILVIQVCAAGLGTSMGKTPPAISSGFIASALAGGFVIVALYLLMVGAAHAATVFAVSDLYLAKTATVRGSFSRVGTKVFRVLLLFIIIGAVLCSAVLLIALIGGALRSPAIFAIGFVALIIPGVIFMCRSAVSIPVAMLEDRGAIRSLERSLQLTKGHSMQIFLIFLLVVFLSWLGLVIFQAPFAAMAVAAAASNKPVPIGLVMLQDLATFVSQVLIGPVGTIAFSLMYYNLRVRKEAFDIQHLMASVTAHPAASAPTAVS
jgi:hypothetical protein